MLGLYAATPALTLSDPFGSSLALSVFRTRSAKIMAPSASEPARTETNSSPPNRAERFIFRVDRPRTSAKIRSASSPTW